MEEDSSIWYAVLALTDRMAEFHNHDGPWITAGRKFNKLILELSSPNVVAASSRGFREAGLSSMSFPLRASPVDGEFIILQTRTPYLRKSDGVATSVAVEICTEANFS